MAPSHRPLPAPAYIYMPFDFTSAPHVTSVRLATNASGSWRTDSMESGQPNTGVWRATVRARRGSELLYKFVVDGEWVVDQRAAVRTDESGNNNNVITVCADAQ